jgi:hypothetical protein
VQAVAAVGGVIVDAVSAGEWVRVSAGEFVDGVFSLMLNATLREQNGKTAAGRIHI